MMECTKKFELSPLFCLHNGVVILAQQSGYLTLGLLDTKNVLLKERLRNAVLLRGIPESALEFKPLNREMFDKRISALLAIGEGKAADTPIAQEENEEAENEAAAFLSAIIETACAEGATDIHIEEDRIRMRTGGKLCTRLSVSPMRKTALIQRIKVLSHLNVVERHRAQDGRFSYTKKNGANVFIRVSVLPALGKNGMQNAESVVLRILDSARVPLLLEELGFEKSNLAMVKKLCSFCQGLILICGATGSGKSTTASAMLLEIQKRFCEAKKIVSLEDPPEYILEGVTQVYINAERQMDFPETLRRTLRQDIDVLMIGEIRDELSAKTAVEAALTGHLVIATVHAATVSQSILRIQDLGASPRLINEVLRGVIVQSLSEKKLTATVSIIGDKSDAR